MAIFSKVLSVTIIKHSCGWRLRRCDLWVMLYPREHCHQYSCLRITMHRQVLVLNLSDIYLAFLATLINTKLWEHQTEAKIIGDTDKDNVLKWCTVFW